MRIARGFHRAHGLGNDYLVVDEATFGLGVSGPVAARICDRNRGVGSDGVLVHIAAPDGHDAAVRIFNPDGSEAEKSGNGVRIFAAWCFANGFDLGAELRIFTMGGTVRVSYVERKAGAVFLRVSMGRASFRMGALPMIAADGRDAGADEVWTRKPLRIGDEDVVTTCVSMGNPHAVLLGARCDDETLTRLGPRVEQHAQFPRRTNVQLCEVLDRRRVRMLVWERGAGPTLASGSSACAVVAACAEAGTVDRDADVTVVMPGGTLIVRIGEDDSVEQLGPVQAICEGTISDDLWSELERSV